MKDPTILRLLTVGSVSLLLSWLTAHKIDVPLVPIGLWYLFVSGACFVTGMLCLTLCISEYIDSGWRQEEKKDELS